MNYVVDYRKTKIPPQYGLLDDKGIPLFDLKHVRLKGKPVYHPTAIIQYGLAHHTLFEAGDIAAEEVFLKVSGWLEENATVEPKGRFIVWNYSHRLLAPQVLPPWISGMAQGQALSLLIRAYQRTHSTLTADVLRKAALSFIYEIDDGGVLSRTAGGNSFIEEYAFKPAIHVLNGCMYSLIGLREFLQVFPNPQLQDVMLSCVRGIEEVLPFYDLGWWSRYSVGFRWNLATFHYHRVHIKLLNYLGEEFDSLVFRNYAKKWKYYERLPRNILRRKWLGMVEVNWNRLLSVMKLSRFRYCRSEAFHE